MWTWRSGRARAFGAEGREFESRSIRKGFCEFGAQSIDDCLLTQLEHTLHMLLPMGRQVVRSRLAVILDIKELATPSFSGRSHGGARISASAMVCVGAAGNLPDASGRWR